jgi:hypothetical protein
MEHYLGVAKDEGISDAEIGAALPVVPLHYRRAIFPPGAPPASTRWKPCAMNREQLLTH